MNAGASVVEARLGRARVALVGGILGWTLLCLGGTEPRIRIVTALLTALLLMVHALDPSRGARCHPSGLLFLPFLAYAALNTAFLTPTGWMGCADWLNWAQPLAVFWVVVNGVVAPSDRRVLGLLVGAFAAVAAAAAVYQHFVDPGWLMLGRRQAAVFIGRSSGTLGIPNSLGALMALVIPPAGFIAGSPGRPRGVRLAAAALLVLLVAAFALAVSRGAWIALACALAIGAARAPGRSAGHRAARALFAVAVACAVAAVLYCGFPMMRLRVDQLVRDLGEHTRPIMWRAALGIFEAHPVFGGGAGSFDTLFEAYRPEGYIDDPVYAHCDYLNTLADYGTTGFILLFGAAAIIAARCRKARGLSAAAAVGLCAFALHLLVDYHLKVPALATAIAAIAGLWVACAWSPEERPIGKRARWTAAVCGGACAVLLVLWGVPQYRAEALRTRARAAIDALAARGADLSRERAALGEIRRDLCAAVARNPSNAQAWSDKAYADSLQARAVPAQMAELGPQVFDSADRAVQLCPGVAEFWIRRGVGLDMQHRWVEAGDSFTRAISLAPVRADVWFYQAYHLSLASTETASALAAADFSLRLDPGFGPAQALRLRLTDRLQVRP